MALQRRNGSYLGREARFPEGIERLNQVHEQQNLGGPTLKCAVKGLEGFNSIKFDVKTSDRNRWFAALHFHRRNYLVIVMLPITGRYDPNTHVTLGLESSCAVYVSNGVDDAVLEELLSELVTALSAEQTSAK